MPCAIRSCALTGGRVRLQHGERGSKLAPLLLKRIAVLETICATSPCTAIESIAGKIGCPVETLRCWGALRPSRNGSRGWSGSYSCVSDHFARCIGCRRNARSMNRARNRFCRKRITSMTGIEVLSCSRSGHRMASVTCNGAEWHRPKKSRDHQAFIVPGKDERMDRSGRDKVLC